MYDIGEGVPENDAEAATWYRKAAEQGNDSAQWRLGAMYNYGWGVPEDDAEAVRWYRLAAEQGHASAQYNLGAMYDYGEGVPENDAEAATWYRKAAEQGNASAQSNLGLMYAKGEGVLKDEAEAVRWYRLAAEQGNATAQFNLGLMYANGRGRSQGRGRSCALVPDWPPSCRVTPQPSSPSVSCTPWARAFSRTRLQAVRWLRLAAEQGHAAAQNNLGDHVRQRAGRSQGFRACAHVVQHRWRKRDRTRQEVAGQS